MECSNTDKHIVIHPQSRLDEQGGKELIQTLRSLIQEHPQLLIIDMADVDFIDSAGLGALVNGFKTAQNQGCQLVLCHLSNTTKLILEITQLDRVFKVFDELDLIFTSDLSLKTA